ncbi:MAG: TonB-dependent receptor [Bacteroidales bacterium]|nr:TonB-dependent receptor [Bacteroidales bacterium]
MRKTRWYILALACWAWCQPGAGAQTPAGNPAAQMPDTVGIYGERKDTLSEVVFTSSGNGNFLSKGKDIRTEVITAAGLCKMACCNLAESFENSASVTVGYSDAVTGARQIRLLGQNGIYTQMLDENRPVMRGLAAPFGLNYVPGQWLESIQIAKGVTSVINGVESMTGQINLEHRKPTDELPLYVQASTMNDTKTDFNLASSLQLDEEGRWNTVLLGHVDGNFRSMDHNGDGFMDDPRQLQFNLGNRWLYAAPSGAQVRFGVRAIRDTRNGGEMPGMTHKMSVAWQNAAGVREEDKWAGRWTSDILNQSYGGYVKAGFPLNEANTSNVALVSDYTYYKMDADFTTRMYQADQHSVFVNLLYQNQDLEQHHFTLGISEMLDVMGEDFSYDVHAGASDWDPSRWGAQLLPPGVGNHSGTRLNDAGVFGEYTFHSADETTFSAIVGVRADWFNLAGWRFSPRLTLKWAPVEALVFRANGGRGLRYSHPIVDNLGVLSTGKTLCGPFMEHLLEDAWTFGANATWYLGSSQKTYLSLDYFRTRFTEQMVLDYDFVPDGGTAGQAILFRPLSQIGSGYSHTDNFQVDFSTEPVAGLTLTLTGRWTDARQSRIAPGATDDVKPMTSRYKGVFNAQYATHLNKWIFDFTASVNGPCKVWDFMRGYQGMYQDGYTPVYPLLYAQVTKRFKGVDLYVGGENLTDYRQPSPILNPADPYGPDFDASCVWGPLMGIKIYAGIRVTIWRTN